MDIFMPIAICVIFLILFSICGWCCKRKREGTVYGYGPTVTVTSQPVQPTPVVVPPYPVDVRHPNPQTSGPHAPGFTTHATPYPLSTPYGQPQPVPTYYPPPIGIVPYSSASGAPYPPVGGAPYPPTGGAPYPPVSGDYSANPPPYDVAVSTPPVQPPLAKEAYGKQAPYNPHFS